MVVRNIPDLFYFDPQSKGKVHEYSKRSKGEFIVSEVAQTLN